MEEWGGRSCGAIARLCPSSTPWARGPLAVRRRPRGRPWRRRSGGAAGVTTAATPPPPLAVVRLLHGGRRRHLRLHSSDEVEEKREDQQGGNRSFELRFDVMLDAALHWLIEVNLSPGIAKHNPSHTQTVEPCWKSLRRTVDRWVGADHDGSAAGWAAAAGGAAGRGKGKGKGAGMLRHSPSCAQLHDPYHPSLTGKWLLVAKDEQAPGSFSVAPQHRQHDLTSVPLSLVPTVAASSSQLLEVHGELATASPWMATAARAEAMVATPLRRCCQTRRRRSGHWSGDWASGVRTC